MVATILAILRWLFALFRWPSQPVVGTVSSFVVGAFSYGAAPATDQGIYKYDGSTWTHVYTGVHNDQILNLQRIPDGSLIMATVDGSIPRVYSLDGGDTWATGGTQYNVTGSGPFGVIGVAEDKAIYDSDLNGGVTTYELLKSTDYGASWAILYDLVHGGFNAPHMIWASRSHLWWTERWSSGPIKNSIIRDDTSVTDIAYTGATLIRGLYSADDVWVWGDIGSNNRHLWHWDGATLTDLTANLPAPVAPWTSTNEQLYSIVPIDTNTIFLASWLRNGGADPTPNNYCRVYRSTDGGGSWTLVLDDSRAVYDAVSDGDGLNFIAVDPSDPTHYVLVAQGGAFESTDSGDTWSFVTGPSGTIEFSSVQFVGANVYPGLARYPSKDAGATWGPPLQ